jgi:Multiubiquitin
VDHRIEEVTHPVDRDASAPEAPLSSVRITVMVENRLVVAAGRATGRQIKQIAGIPGDFALYRRVRGGNQFIRDEDTVDVRNGDHFFARPPGQGG